MQRPDREEWLAASFSFARATMLGTAALCWIAALGADPRYLKSNALGVTVNAIAFVHYNQMQADFVRGKGVWATRFSDWAATVPLMVLEVYALLGSTLLRALPAAGLSLLMIVLGALSQVHPERGGVLVTLSFGALCGVYALVVTEGLDAAVSASTVAVAAGPGALWVLYGAGFVLGWPGAAFNLLDVGSKCGLAMGTVVLSMEG